MMAPPLGAEFSRHPMERLQLSPVMVRWRGDDGEALEPWFLTV